MEKLKNFFSKYKNHERMSGDCALDGRYFWKVLQPYPGLIRSELYIRVNDFGNDLKISPPAWDHRELFENTSLGPYRIVKILIDIGQDPMDNAGSVHSNLLYFDVEKKNIVRFEPMLENRYSYLINDVLRAYFAGLLPSFSYEMRKDHPQLPTTEKCPRKGFCAAYTLKAAMLVITGKENHRMDGNREVEEEKIMTFASAIQEEYGLYPDEEPEDLDEFGRHQSRSKNKKSALESIEFLGLPPRKFINLQNPNEVAVNPENNPRALMYSAPYYGYVYGLRYLGSPGWGWGRPSWAPKAPGQEFGCGCGARRKLPQFK